MIPIVILLSFVAGRWWSVPVLAAAWGALLYGDGVAASLPAAMGAVALAAVNSIAGVGVRQMIADRELVPSDAVDSDVRIRPDTANVLSFLRLDPSA